MAAKRKPPKTAKRYFSLVHGFAPVVAVLTLFSLAGRDTYAATDGSCNKAFGRLVGHPGYQPDYESLISNIETHLKNEERFHWGNWRRSVPFSKEEFKKAIEQSFSIRPPPKLSSVDTSTGNNLIVVDGHLVFDQFFRKATRNYRYDSYSSGQLTRQQPYFHWNSNTGKYELRHGVPIESMIRRHVDEDGNITFYRGLRSAVELASWPASMLTGTIYDLSMRRSLLHTVFDFPPKDALFFSLDKAHAQQFGFILASFKMKKDDFLRIFYEGQVYAGYEWGHVEVAFENLDQINKAARRIWIRPTLIRPYED